jgi:hypothetical protein
MPHLGNADGTGRSFALSANMVFIQSTNNNGQHKNVM